MAIRNEDLGGVDYQDTGSTLLNGAINDSVTTITVDSTTGFKTGGGSFRINSELIDYTGVTATTFTGCTRGQHGTTAASHLDNAPVLEREVVKAVDLNDTFDALVNKANTLTAFWLNDELYDVKENFNSYTTGNAVTSENPTDWTHTGGGSFVVSATTNAGGDTKEGYFLVSSSAFVIASGTIEYTNLEANKHTHVKLSLDCFNNPAANAKAHVKVSYNGGTTYYTLASFPSQDVVRPSRITKHQLTVIAQGSDTYDIYLNQIKIASSVSIATPSLKFEILTDGDGTGSAPNGYVYIDDIIQSKGSV